VKDAEDTAIPVRMLIGVFIRVQYHHSIMRCTVVDHVFITPDIVCGVVEAQEFVLIDTITSANDTEPVAASAVVVDRGKVGPYQRPYAWEEVLFQLGNEVLTHSVSFYSLPLCRFGPSMRDPLNTVARTEPNLWENLEIFQ
jgi:hypothetical protein